MKQEPIIVAWGVLSQAEFESLTPKNQIDVEESAKELGEEFVRSDREAARGDIQLAYGFDED